MIISPACVLIKMLPSVGADGGVAMTAMPRLWSRYRSWKTVTAINVYLTVRHP